MCSNCYHIKGRAKRAWKCEHTLKAHYAKGLCQNCYQINYSNDIKNGKKSNIPNLYSNPNPRFSLSRTHVGN